MIYIMTETHKPMLYGFLIIIMCLAYSSHQYLGVFLSHLMLSAIKKCFTFFFSLSVVLSFFLYIIFTRKIE